MLVILVISSISTLLNLNLSRAFPNRMRMPTSNNKHGSFLIKNNENIYPKGRALIHMYRVVPQTK